MRWTENVAYRLKMKIICKQNRDVYFLCNYIWIFETKSKFEFRASWIILNVQIVENLVLCKKAVNTTEVQ